MAITVERDPYVVVTDVESGWSLRGGQRTGDGYQTKEMVHPNGARCTVQITQFVTSDEIKLDIIGMLYLNPGEDRGTSLRKVPTPGDFVTASALYQIAQTLARAWYEASFQTLPRLIITIPRQ